MNITEKTSQHRVEIVGEFKHLIVETKTVFLRDDAEIEGTEKFHRDSISCGDFDKADALGVRAYADMAWTPDVLSGYAVHKITVENTQE